MQEKEQGKKEIIVKSEEQKETVELKMPKIINPFSVGDIMLFMETNRKVKERYTPKEEE